MTDPAPAPSKRRSTERRAKILDAAARLFADRGFHGVSIDDLGRAVGTSGPALYRHFRGKEAVLAEMLLDISERLHEEGERLAASASSSEAALDLLLRRHIDFALDEPALITVQWRELGNVPEPERHEIRRLQRMYVERWVEVLTRLRPGEHPVLLRACVQAAFGLLNSTPYSAAELSRAEMVGLLYAMARSALLSGPAMPENGGA
ncbi:MAG: TetR family transcriptional regulator [Streptosporangiales bacterium]|nr:TetR family transcriptional regulator [Streptosporangiales bacterium]